NGQDYDSAGANFLSNAGAAYIFSRESGSWNYIRKITPPPTGTTLFASDQLGISVGISGDYIIAGSLFHDWDSAGGNYKANAGAAFIFEKPGCNLTYNNGWAGSSPSGSTGACNCTVSAGTAPIASGASLATLTVNSGATASLSGNLSLSGNYTNNGTVSGAGKIVLNGSSAQNIYGTGTTGNLELNNPVSAIVQDSLRITGILTLTAGTLTTNDKLKLEATGPNAYGQIAGTGAGTISGTLTAEMRVNGGGTGWRPVSSPLAGATLSALADEVNFNFGTPGSAYATVYYFNEQTAPYWTIPADTSAAFGDSAFSIYMGGSSSWGNPLPLTLDIQGTYRGTSDYTYNNLTRTGSIADTLGWHYVANPWPSGFTWDDANITVNSGGIQGSQIWLYNQSAGAYQVFDATDNGVVPPFSPLLFEVTGNNTSITLKNSARTTDSLVNYFDKTGLMNYVEINVTDKNGKSDRVKFYTDDAATNGYDIMDGNKKINPAAPNMYFVLDGKKANKEVWNNIPNANEPVFVNMEAWENGDYTLAFAVENLEAGVTVELEDKLAGKRHDLSTGNYAFNYSTTDIKNRFQLHFFRKSGVSVEEITNDVFVGTDGNVLSLSTTNAGVYTVEVFDLLGRTIQSPATVETGAGQPQTLAVPGASPGYYLVKVSGNYIHKTFKVYLK
ncbi:MAG TPA: T9SS type A sorting domain-containing protein, partial [Bacteroidia bacterium]|nr:T9SS type A sorting domain-containing protein [Bacteroidia bacterium]